MSSSIDLQSILWLVLTSAVWGTTTPFIKRGSKGIERARHSNIICQSLLELKFMLTNYQYWIPLLINLCGSVIYTISLSYNQLSIAVPITNALNFVFVAITAKLLGESNLNMRSLFGSFLVMTGVVVCVCSKT